MTDNMPQHNPDSAKDKAADVAASTKNAAGDVAHTATNAVKDVSQVTKDQAGDLYRQTKVQLSDQVGTQKSALVDTLRSLGDQLAGMTDHVEQSGTAVDVASRARDRARDAADWLDGHEPTQVLDELRTVGRRQPGKFLLGAFVAGVVAGRLTRGAVAVHTDDATAPTTQPTPADPSMPPSAVAAAVPPPVGGPTPRHATQPALSPGRTRR